MLINSHSFVKLARVTKSQSQMTSIMKPAILSIFVKDMLKKYQTRYGQIVKILTGCYLLVTAVC